MRHFFPKPGAHSSAQIPATPHFQLRSHKIPLNIPNATFGAAISLQPPRLGSMEQSARDSSWQARAPILRIPAKQQAVPPGWRQDCSHEPLVARNAAGEFLYQAATLPQHLRENPTALKRGDGNRARSLRSWLPNFGPFVALL